MAPTHTPTTITTPREPPQYIETLTESEQAAANTHLIQFKMFDSLTGWVLQYIDNFPTVDNHIYRTVDGGQLWTDVSPPVPEGSYAPAKAAFLDAKNAVVLYTRQYLPTSGEVEVTAWRTVDGGITWHAGETINSNLGVFSTTDILMTDPQHGWLMGMGQPAMGSAGVYLNVTKNGGMDWQPVYAITDHLSDSFPLWTFNFYPYLDHFSLLSDTLGFFSNGKLAFTSDGGSSWAPVYLDPPDDIPDVDCKGPDCKYRDTLSAPAFTSKTDGVLIRRVYLNSEEIMMTFSYGARLEELPIAQYLYFTRDAGETWIPRHSPTSIGTVSFIDADGGWLLGKNDPDPNASTQLYRTEDGGETWSLVSDECPLPLGSELQFVDGETGFAFLPFTAWEYYGVFDARVSRAPRLFSTSDGGFSWDEIGLQLAPGN